MLGNTELLLQIGIHAGSVFTNTLLSKVQEQIWAGMFDFDTIAVFYNKKKLKQAGLNPNAWPKTYAGFEAMLEEPAMRIGANAIDWVIGGGEDHSLLATFTPDTVIPRAFKPIGRVIEREDFEVLLDAQPLAERGWDSFAT